MKVHGGCGCKGPLIYTASINNAWVVKRIVSAESLARRFVLVHELSCVLYEPQVMGVTELYGGERELRGYIAGCILTT